MLGEQGAQPLLVLLGDRVDGAARAEGGEEHGEQQHHRHEVDEDVHPAGRGDGVVDPVVRGQGDQPHHAVAPTGQEGGLGGVRIGVGGADEQGRDQRGDQQARGRHHGGQRGVGAVAPGVELPAAQPQGGDEGGGQAERDPVLRVVPELRVAHVPFAAGAGREPRHGEGEQQGAAHRQVQDPGGAFAPAAW